MGLVISSRSLRGATSGALGGGGIERETDHSFQDGDRGLLRPDEPLAGDDERLFERVLAAEARVAARVGEDDPGRIGRELPAVLWTLALEGLVLLEEVVKAEHELVVRGPIEDRYAHRREQADRLAAEPGQGVRPVWQARLRGVAPGQLLEALRRHPDPRAPGVDVGEDPQEP